MLCSAPTAHQDQHCSSKHHHCNTSWTACPNPHQRQCRSVRPHIIHLPSVLLILNNRAVSSMHPGDAMFDPVLAPIQAMVPLSKYFLHQRRLHHHRSIVVVTIGRLTRGAIRVPSQCHICVRARRQRTRQRVRQCQVIGAKQPQHSLDAVTPLRWR